MSPQTERSDTRGTIVDAAARLLQEHGPDAVTTRGVAQAARVQAPTIYRLFGDKEGLLDAVAEHVVATYVDAKAATAEAAAANDVDPLEDLRSGWHTQIDFGLANPTLFALLSDPRRSHRSPAAAAGREVLRTRVHRLAEAGLLRVGEERAVELIHAAGTGAVTALLAAAPDRRDTSLAEDLLAAVLHQILADEAAPVDDPVTTSAVTLRSVATTLEVLSDGERALLVEWLDRVAGAS